MVCGRYFKNVTEIEARLHIIRPQIQRVTRLAQIAARLPSLSDSLPSEPAPQPDPIAESFVWEPRTTPLICKIDSRLLGARRPQR